MNLPFEYNFTWKILWWFPLCERKRQSCPVEQDEFQLFTVGLFWDDERGYA